MEELEMTNLLLKLNSFVGLVQGQDRSIKDRVEEMKDQLSDEHYTKLKRATEYSLKGKPQDMAEALRLISQVLRELKEKI